MDLRLRGDDKSSGDDKSNGDYKSSEDDNITIHVIPAQAGTYLEWISAYAEMTKAAEMIKATEITKAAEMTKAADMTFISKSCRF